MSAALVKDLREKTGAGILACKKALIESEDDIVKAVEILRIKGIDRSNRRASNSTKEGLVYSYIHHDKRTGVLLELNCETDFVAINDGFEELAHKLSLHIVAAKPQFVSTESVPPLLEVSERELYRRKTLDEGKPVHIVDKIVEGRMNKFYKEVCLLNQEYILDEALTIEDLIKTYITKFGENIRVKKFSLFIIGEE